MEAKSRGNQLFSRKQYREALESYTSALTKSPKDSRLYTNRALCHIKLTQWENVVQDCQSAIQIDETAVKAYFYLGQAYMEMDNFDGAIEAFTNAHGLAKEQRRNFGDDITSALRLAKRKRWQKQEQVRINQQSDLLHLLNNLLESHKDKLLADTQNSSLSAEEDYEKKKRDVIQQHEKRVAELQRVFEEADNSRKVRDVPDYLCGKISFELMTDPCITPSGITYDRKDIEEHLSRVGHFDPITRTKLTSDQLIPNLAMKEVVDDFMTGNEWIEEY